MLSERYSCNVVSELICFHVLLSLLSTLFVSDFCLLCQQGSLGKVTIQIDRVVLLGTISGQYTLMPDANRDGTPRTLEIEFQWSNR